MKITDLTPQQVHLIADAMGTSANSIRHVTTGRRGVTAQRAIAIEKAAAKVGLEITRESLNAGCAKCEFARSCRKTQKASTK